MMMTTSPSRQETITGTKNTVKLTSAAGIANQETITVNADGTLDMSESSGNLSGTTLTNVGTTKMGSGMLKTTNDIINDGTLILNNTKLQSNITTSGNYGTSTVQVNGGTMNLSGKTIKTAHVHTYGADTEATFDLKNLNIGRDTSREKVAFELYTGSTLNIKNTGDAKTYDNYRENICSSCRAR